MGGKQRVVRRKRAIKIVDQRTGKAIRGTLEGKMITLRRAIPLKERVETISRIIGKLEDFFQQYAEMGLADQATMRDIKRRAFLRQSTQADLAKAQRILGEYEKHPKHRKAR